jgi:DNA invertase Pin-like site-specific DNA recombinase
MGRYNKVTHHSGHFHFRSEGVGTVPFSEDVAIALIGSMAAIIGALGLFVVQTIKARQASQRESAKLDQDLKGTEVDRLQGINKGYYEEVKKLQEDYFAQGEKIRELSCKYDSLAREFAAVKLENQRLQTENRILRESMGRLKALEAENVDLKARIVELEKKTGGQPKP